jgi:hypothetical protein
MKFALKKLIGLTEKAAEKRVAGQGFISRTVEREGEHFICTMELRNNRINLRIKNGLVYEAEIG